MKDNRVGEGRLRLNEDKSFTVLAPFGTHKIFEGDSVEVLIKGKWFSGKVKKNSSAEWGFLPDEGDISVLLKSGMIIRYQLSKSELEIDSLELNLASLTTEWRKLQHQQIISEAAKVAEEYNIIIAKLWRLGWDGEGLLPDSMLPDELMPKYFLEKWNQTF